MLIQCVIIKKGENMKNKLFTALFGVAIFFFIITFSIGLPIYCRFFYYMQIEALNLPASTGYDYATIKVAFDEVMNFLTLPGFEFGTGVFKYSQAGKAHFYDCKVLFDLNFYVLIASTIIIASLLILSKLKFISFCRPFNMHVAFLSCISIFTVIAIIAILIFIAGFDNAFTVFHHIFFPGKDNWQFDYFEDEIIRILPQQFFLSCAVLIGASIVIISLTVIVFQLIKRHKIKKQQ